jgi:hypothetical protein
MAEEFTAPVAQYLKRLKEIDPKLRTEFMRQAKNVARPVESSIKSEIPTVSPLSGAMNRGRLGWGIGKTPTSTTIKFSGAGKRSTSVTPLLKIVVNSAAVSIMDMAGRKGGGNTPSGRGMIRVLNGQKAASRYVYPGGLKAVDQAVAELKSIIDSVADFFNRKSF